MGYTNLELMSILVKIAFYTFLQDKYLKVCQKIMGNMADVVNVKCREAGNPISFSISLLFNQFYKYRLTLDTNIMIFPRALSPNP